jgi:single-stranded-DNA-specific exonuclease
MKVIIGKTSVEVPYPELRFRRRNDAVYKAMIESGESNIVSIIASNRVSDFSQKTFGDLFNPSLRGMQYWKLKDIELAAQRIVDAKLNNETIGLITDFDVDGICSAVVMKLALTEYMGFDSGSVNIHVNNRMLYGYGFTSKALAAVASRSGGKLPTLLITADQGSNDNLTVKEYKDLMFSKGFKHASVVITDHHHIKENETCADAVAFVNPQRQGDEFDDKTICGCVVALLVMSAARDLMIAQKVLPDTTPKLTPLLTYASLATVADCVSLKSGYNRCIVRKGLSDINKGVIPAWVVIKDAMGSADVTAKDIGFKLGPLINADSRTGGDGSDSVNFLMATTVADAKLYYDKLVVRNIRRKEKDHAMQEVAIAEASDQYYKSDKKALVVYLPQGSHGIHGIVASRVKDKFNCPAVMFSPVDTSEKDSDEKLITGSGRCIDDLSLVHMVMDVVGQKVSLVGGGHHAAMGVKMKLGDLALFKETLNDVVIRESKAANFSDDAFSPKVMIDHIIQDDELCLINDMSILKDISRLEPYGQKFESPIFGINGQLISTTCCGKEPNKDAHLRMFFKDSSGVVRDAIAFFFAAEPWINEIEIGMDYTFAVTLDYNAYAKGVGMQIVLVTPGKNAVVRPSY